MKAVSPKKSVVISGKRSRRHVKKRSQTIRHEEVDYEIYRHEGEWYNAKTEMLLDFVPEDVDSYDDEESSTELKEHVEK